jgi:hypothetical protein
VSRVSYQKELVTSERVSDETLTCNFRYKEDKSLVDDLNRDWVL